MYESILLPTDGSDGALAAAEQALDLLADGGTLHVLYAVDPRMSPLTADMDRAAVLDILDNSPHDPTAPVLDLAADAGVSAVEAIEIGPPHEVITDYVADHGIDLVVMGTHGRTGLQHALLGSVTERVVRLADVPVLTVHPDT